MFDTGQCVRVQIHMGVSKNRGSPKSSILIGFSIINHPFWGTPIFGNTHILIQWSQKKRAGIFLLVNCNYLGPGNGYPAPAAVPCPKKHRWIKMKGYILRYPIRSMYGIYTYMNGWFCGKCVVKNTSPRDRMGIDILLDFRVSWFALTCWWMHRMMRFIPLSQLECLFATWLHIKM